MAAASSKAIGLKFFTRSVAQFRPVVAGSRFCHTNIIGGGHCQSKDDRSINRPAYEYVIDFVLDKYFTIRTIFATPFLSNTIKSWRTIEGPELSKQDVGLKNPGIKLLSFSHDEVKFRVPMPGMTLDQCSYGWDVDGWVLTLHADDGHDEYRYTPQFERRFRHGKVTFESLAEGFLVVSVKPRGY